MAGIYDELKTVASDLLSEFGQGVIKYIKITPNTGDEDEPGEATETEYTVDGAARGVKYKYVLNGFAVATDLQVTIATTGKDASDNVVAIVPAMNGFIEVDGVRYKIVKILPKPAAGTTVAYVIIIRK